MYQKLIIVGNLGRDPEMKYLPDGNAVTSFAVATSRKVSGEKETVWFRISVWGKQAETCNQYLGKGSKVLVEGRLSADENGNPKVFKRNDGSSGSSFEVRADTVQFLSCKGETDPGEPTFADNIPF